MLVIVFVSENSKGILDGTDKRQIILVTSKFLFSIKRG